jgi:hypothetical protein
VFEHDGPYTNSIFPTAELLLRNVASHSVLSLSDHVRVNSKPPLAIKKVKSKVLKSRRMRWTGHVARMGEGRGVYRVLVGKPEGKRPLGDRGVDGRIMLGWIFKRWDMGVRTGLGWFRIVTGGGRL